MTKVQTLLKKLTPDQIDEIATNLAVHRRAIVRLRDGETNRLNCNKKWLARVEEVAQQLEVAKEANPRMFFLQMPGNLGDLCGDMFYETIMLCALEALVRASKDPDEVLFDEEAADWFLKQNARRDVDYAECLQHFLQ